MPLIIPYTFRTAGKNTPLSRLDVNFAAIAAHINTRVAAIGPLVSRPAAGHAGALYIASDQHFAWYIDDGAVWQPVGGMGPEGAITVNPQKLNVRFFGADAGTDGERVITGLIGTPPTTSPPDVAQLYVADKQGENSRAAWHTRAEGLGPRPVDPVLFRRVGEVSGFVGLTGTGEQSLFAATLKGGTLVGRALEVACRFDVASPSTARTLTLRVKLGPGPTTLATVAMALPTLALGNGVVTIQVDALDVAVQRASIQHVVLIPAFTSTTLTTVDGALDAATDLALAVTAQWSAGGGTMNAYTLTVRLL
jgi:hypothetical protein